MPTAKLPLPSLPARPPALPRVGTGAAGRPSLPTAPGREGEPGVRSLPRSRGDGPGSEAEASPLPPPTPHPPRPGSLLSSPMTMRRCLRRVSASFLVSSTFWVDFFTSPCGFLENILRPPRPLPAGSPRRSAGGGRGRGLAAAAHALPRRAGRAARPASRRRRHRRCTEPAAPAPIWRIRPARCSDKEALSGGPPPRPRPGPHSSGDGALRRGATPRFPEAPLRLKLLLQLQPRRGPNPVVWGWSFTTLPSVANGPPGNRLLTSSARDVMLT